RPLFGTFTGALAGRVTVPVLRVDHDTVRLQAGLGVGLAPGTELRLADTLRDKSGRAVTGASVRLRVTVVSGLGASDAVASAGSVKHLEAGTLFVVDRWTLANGAGLRVFIPPGREASALTRDIAALAPLRESGVAEWVDDPTAIPNDGRPLHTIRYETGGWRVVGPSGAVRLASTTAAEVERAIASAENAAMTSLDGQRVALRAAGAQPDSVLPAARAKARVTVLLPPTVGLRSKIRLGKGAPNDVVDVVDNPSAADFFLVGRSDDSGTSYAWVRPNATQESQRLSSIPARTLWVGATAPDVAGDSLNDLATRLARLHAWLSLAQPPDTNATPFPYRLALRNRATGALRDSGETHEGESYDLVLRRDSSVSAGKIEPRWVYVLAIDSYGRGIPLFPSAGLGGNQLPMDSAGVRIAPLEFTLPRRAPIRIVPPYGVDTFILLTTSEPIDPEVLRFDGVRGASEGGSGALSQLLSRVGRKRGVGDDASTAQWSVQHLALRSGPAKPTNP
ncbi:MAG TPA: hypothetical protein VH762_13615, partial [Gemmatimonadaceae bacterium]